MVICYNSNRKLIHHPSARVPEPFQEGPWTELVEDDMRLAVFKESTPSSQKTYAWTPTC